MIGVVGESRIRVYNEGHLEDIKIKDLIQEKRKILCYDNSLNIFERDSYEVIKKENEIIYNYLFDSREENLSVRTPYDIIANPYENILLIDGSMMHICHVETDFKVLVSNICKYDTKLVYNSVASFYFNYKYNNKDTYSLRINKSCFVVINGFLIGCD